MTDVQRKRLLYYLSILGKWSMLDVFVASIIIVAVKLGVLASAKVEKGIYFFGMSIFLAMIITTLEYNLTHRSRTSNTAS
jgi:paraquat-inducible protein A